MGKVEKLDKARGKAGTRSAAGALDKGRARQAKTRRRCPICRAPAVQKYRPFCSKRCADVDLGRWIGGDYRIAGNPANALNQEDNNGEDQD